MNKELAIKKVELIESILIELREMGLDVVFNTPVDLKYQINNWPYEKTWACINPM